MANTLTNINDSKIMARGVAAFKDGLLPLSAFTLDVSSEQAGSNEYVYVPIPTALTAGSFSSSYESGDSTITGMPVRLTGHLHKSWHLTEVQKVKTPVEAFEILAPEAAYSVAKLVVTTTMNAITASAFAETPKVGTAGTMTADWVADLAGQCAKLGWPQGVKPTMVIGVDLYTALLKDPAIQDLSASGSGNLQTGVLPDVAGFRIIRSNIIPTNSENLVGFACVPQCLGVAIRPIVTLGGSWDADEIATDPDSGVSMRYRRWVNTANGNLWGMFGVFMGAAAVQGSGLVRITSS